jgi:hypothetical protein
LAKFLGVVGAVALAHYLCTIGVLMTIRHGVLSTASDTHDWTVVGSATVVAVVTVLLSAFFNYTYDWKFTSTAVVVGAILATLAMVFLTLIDRDWQFNPSKNGFDRLDVYAAILLFLAATVIAAIAVAISSRFNVIVTLSACIGVFLLGLISDWVFGRYADTHLWAQAGRYLVPNLQVFWISDAIYENSVVPFRYILTGASYAITYIVGILAVAVALFQRRQIA